jgi:hypothetical protein
MLPNFSALRLRQVVVQTGAPEKRKRGEEMFFKAWFTDPGRYHLSNLFGIVEWKHQQSKFKPESSVYNWLQNGIDMERCNKWTPEAFKAECKQMGVVLKGNNS